MRFLLDKNVSFRVGVALADHGHDAVHVDDLSMGDATDPEIMQRARQDDRIIISADTDFGAYLAADRATEPSVMLIREVSRLPSGELATRWDGEYANVLFSGMKWDEMGLDGTAPDRLITRRSQVQILPPLLLPPLLPEPPHVGGFRLSGPLATQAATVGSGAVTSGHVSRDCVVTARHGSAALAERSFVLRPFERNLALSTSGFPTRRPTPACRQTCLRAGRLAA